MLTVFFARGEGKLKSQCISQQSCDPEYLDEGSGYLPFEGLTPCLGYLTPLFHQRLKTSRKSALMEFCLLVQLHVPSFPLWSHLPFLNLQYCFSSRLEDCLCEGERGTEMRYKQKLLFQER